MFKRINKNQGSGILVVGLGNPGAEYALTRHNAGFMIVQKIAESMRNLEMISQYGGFFGTGRLAGTKLSLLMPQEYMNCSGEAVQRAAKANMMEPQNILVVYDDVDLPPGRIRFRKGGSSGGHRGIQSIIEEMDTESFCRLRIGVGRPETADEETADYVLETFTSTEMELMDKVFKEAVKGVKHFVRMGVGSAANRFNGVFIE